MQEEQEGEREYYEKEEHATPIRKVYAFRTVGNAAANRIFLIVDQAGSEGEWVVVRVGGCYPHQLEEKVNSV